MMNPDKISETSPSKDTEQEKSMRKGIAYLVQAKSGKELPAAVSNDVPTIPKNYRRTLVWVVAVIAVLGVLTYFGAQRLLGPKVIAYQAVKGDVVQTIVTSGRVETPLRADVASQIVGTVASVPVAEGQSVKAGQLLVSLDDGELRATFKAAQAAVVQAQARLKQIESVAQPTADQALRRADATLANQRKQYERLKELRAQNLASQAQVDDAATALEVTESEVRSARLQVDTNRPNGADYALAKTGLDQAKANLVAARARLDYAKITAPVAGTLIKRDVERGDVVQPGKQLMVLSPEGQTQLVVQIDEKNLSSLQIGQPALASADAYPNSKFAASVAYINPGVDATRGSVLVKLNVLQPPDYLRQDMTVSVDIEVARHPDTLVVKADAIHNGSSAAPWVFKIVNGRAERQPVELGARGSGSVEILQGLKAGDEVVSSLASTVAEGNRVRAQTIKSRKDR